MSQLTTTPIIDAFETTLAQSWNWLTGTIYVDDIPSATLSWWEKTYAVVNPWKTTQQVARISAWTSGQLTCDSVTIEKWAGTNYSSTTHAVKSKVIITDTYQNWKDVKTAVNSKANTDNPTFTTMITGPVYARLSALTTAYPTPTNGMQSAYCTLEWQYYDAQWWSRQPRASWSNPNASTTVAGKVEKSTPSEVTAGTSTGGTGAELFVWPAELKTVTDAINTSISDNNVDVFWLFWDWSDWDVTITTTVTLVRDMYYNNLTITSPWILNPNWYKFYVKWSLLGDGKIQRNGNAWGNASWQTQGTGWAALNQWTLQADIWWVAWGIWGAWNGWNWAVWVVWNSTNPSYTNINWTAGGAGWTTTFWWTWGTGWAAGTSTRWSLYNFVQDIYTILQALLHVASSYNLTYPSTLYKSISSWGWGWGGWGANPWWVWWWWGGSWSNGWIVWSSIKNVNWTGTWECIWWTWGTGWVWSNWVNAGSWGGWGSWWSGWIIILLYKTITSLWTVTVTGWTWGTKWLKWTWLYWTDWVNWANWNTWEIIQIQL